MKIEEIKKKMINYIDLGGNSLLGKEEINQCETKEELAEIFEQYHDFIEAVANDTQNALLRFKNKLGLNDNYTK